MEGDQKKRGTRDEDPENFCYNKKKTNYLRQPVEKQYLKVEPYNSCNRGKTEVGQSSNEDINNYRSSGVFDFPWLREGIVSNSEDWNHLEDTFSASLEDSYFRSLLKFSGCLYEPSSSSSSYPATAEIMNFDEQKWVFNGTGDGYELGSETEGMDCIWGSLLNQPLHSGRRWLS